MTIEELLTQARKTWGDTPMTLEHIALALEVVSGDICRQARNKTEGQPVDENELKKELGNLVTSGIRWCNDLGYDPQECIRISQEAQTCYAVAHPPKW